MEEGWCVGVKARTNFVIQAYGKLPGRIRTVSLHSHSIIKPSMVSPCSGRITQRLVNISARSTSIILGDHWQRKDSNDKLMGKQRQPLLLGHDMVGSCKVVWAMLHNTLVPPQHLS